MAPQTKSLRGRPASELPTTRQLARRVLFAFLVTFMVSRVAVFLIMARKVPDFYLHLGGTHVHHLNYGIFLLAAVGATCCSSRPQIGVWPACSTVSGWG